MCYKVPEFIHLFPLSAEPNECVWKEQYPIAKTFGKAGFWYSTDKLVSYKPHGLLLTGWTSCSAHLKDREAAYHVRNRQATDICHLQSFIIPLPVSAPPNTRSHTLCFFCHTVPTSKASPPLIFLITQTVHSSTPSSSPVWGNEKDEMAENGEGEDGGDNLFVFGGLVFWKVLLRQQKPFL